MSMLIVSKQCKHSQKLLQVLKGLSNVKIKVNDISTLKQVPVELRSVPALIMENGKILHGKEAFMWIEAQASQASQTQMDNPENVNAFEFGFGTNNFSYIEGEGLAEVNRPYTSIVGESAPKEMSHTDTRMQALMDARQQDAHIPQPVQRT